MYAKHPPCEISESDSRKAANRTDLRTCLSADSSPRVQAPSPELYDELNDAEIYRAVVTSMNDWQRRQDLKKINNR